MIERLSEYLPLLGPATGVTFATSVAAMALATSIGGLMAAGTFVRARAVRVGVRVYVEIGRAVPELIMVYVWFYVLPDFGILLAPAIAGVLALAVTFGSYLTEVIRGGIIGVEATQAEAGQVLGMSPYLVWRRVILPQAARNVLPVWTSYFVSIFKASAFLSVITVPELLYVGGRIAAFNFRFFEVYALVGLLYFAISYPSILGLRRLEKRWSDPIILQGHSSSAGQGQRVT